MLWLETRPVTRGDEDPQEKSFPPLETCVGHSLKLLDIVQKIWDPVRKLFAPPGVPSWLRTCLKPSWLSIVLTNGEYQDKI